MGAAFFKGTKSAFLNMLNAPYGFIAVEECDTLEIYTLEQGRKALSDAKERDLISADEAQTMDAAMVMAGLSENLPALFDRIRQAELKLPADFVPEYYFKICACGNPDVHGRAHNSETHKRSTDSLFTLGEVLMECHKASFGRVGVANATHVFKQALETNLPVDEAEWKKTLFQVAGRSSSSA